MQPVEALIEAILQFPHHSNRLQPVEILQVASRKMLYVHARTPVRTMAPVGRQQRHRWLLGGVAAVLVGVAAVVQPASAVNDRIGKCKESEAMRQLCRWCHNDVRLQATYSNCCRENPSVFATCKKLYVEVFGRWPESWSDIPRGDPKDEDDDGGSHSKTVFQW